MNKKLDIQYHGLTDTGKTRATNEDCFWCGDVCGGRFVLAAVIDGCGGHQGGLQAATITRGTLVEYLSQDHTGDTASWLNAAMIEANNRVYCGRYDDEALAEMCCVATAIIIDREQRMLYMAHVGDTRLYASYEGRIIKLSHDHAPIGKKEELGFLSETEAMSHWQRNVIDRAVGHRFLYATDPYVEMQSFPLTGGLTLMLCSDGLYDMVTSAQMSGILRQQKTPEEMATELVEAANQAGGKDNVTVVVLHTSPEEEQETARMMDTYAERMNPYKKPVSASRDIPVTQPEPEDHIESAAQFGQQPATDSQPESGNQSEFDKLPDSENRSEPENPSDPARLPSSQEESLDETPATPQQAPVQEEQPEPEPEPEPDTKSGPEPHPQPDSLSEDPQEQPQAQSPQVPHTPECGKPSADNSQAGPQKMETPSETQGIEPEPMSSLPFTRTEKQKRRAKAIDRIIFVAVWLVMVVFILIGFRYWQSQKQAFIRIQNQMIRQQMEIQQLQDSINQLQDSIRTLQIRFHNDTVIIQSDTKQSHLNVLLPNSDERKFARTESRASSIDYAEVKPNFKTTKLD